MGSVDLNMNNTHNRFPPWDEGLHHNWRIDSKRLKYRAAFALVFQTRIVDK